MLNTKLIKITLILLVILSSACTSSYYQRPIQDQVVGGSSILDAITGRDRVGLIAKQAHYDSFISKPVPSNQWFAHVPILNLFSRPSSYEVCKSPPADAMASIASSFAAFGGANISGNEDNTGVSATATITLALAASFANKVKAFSIRTQGLQYIRDIRFDNCLIWQNRGNLNPKQESKLRIILEDSNARAGIISENLIIKELLLRAITDNFGASSVEVSKEQIDAINKQVEANLQKIKILLENNAKK